MVETRKLKYRGKDFYPLTDFKSVIDKDNKTLDDLLITSDKAGTINDIDQSLYTNALRKTEQILNDNEKVQVEKNLGLDVKFDSIYRKFAKTTDVTFDVTQLYDASESGHPIDGTFKDEMLDAVKKNKILFASIRTHSGSVTAIFSFVRRFDSTVLFVAVGKDFRYNLFLDIGTNLVVSERQPIGSSFNRYINFPGSDIFHITTSADNSAIQKMLTTEKGEIMIPSVGDVFELHETTPELGKIIHYSGIVTSRVEANSDQDIILVSNDLKDDFIMFHHIKLTYVKENGISSLSIQKAYHMIVNPYDLEINNRNIVFYNNSSNSIFTANDGTPNEQLKNMFKDKYQELQLPLVGDMFVAHDVDNDNELTEAGVVISEYDDRQGFIIKMISNNSVFEYWTLHTIKFAYNESQKFDSLRIIDAYHTVVDPDLIEHVKLSQLYADVERLKNNSILVENELDNINGEVI